MNNILNRMEMLYKINNQTIGAKFKIETRNAAIIRLSTDSPPQ